MLVQVSGCCIGSIEQEYRAWTFSWVLFLAVSLIRAWSINCTKFEIVGEIANVDTIDQGSGIRDISLLRKQYGLGDWRKQKGIAQIKLPDGSMVMAEIHWHEAHSIGKVKIKIKEWL